MTKNKSTGHTEIWGLFIWTITLLATLSLVSFSNSNPSKNWLGLVGYNLAGGTLYLFGLSSFLLMIYGAVFGWKLMRKTAINHKPLKIICIFVSLISLCLLLSVVAQSFPRISLFAQDMIYVGKTKMYNINSLRYNLGGVPCYYLYSDLPKFNLHYLFHSSGVTIIFSISFVVSLILLFEVHPLSIFPSIKEKLAGKPASVLNVIKALFEKKEKRTKESKIKRFFVFLKKLFKRKKGEIEGSKKESTFPFNPPYESLEKVQLKKVKVPTKKPKVTPFEQKIQYELPPTSLLTAPRKVDTSSMTKGLQAQSRILEETLFNFGIEAKVIDINCGPTITSFEVQPAIGVKVQKIKALEKDIALNMRAKSIRIIAPIPGKAAVGIEVPNSQSQEVNFREMIVESEQKLSKFNIPLFLGQSVHGENVIADLTKMPHCIIAGATGSGKSVCINTIIMSILMRFSPDEVKLMLVDPKKVELMPYTNLPHMIAPVITEPKWACAALNWLVKEMEYRYEVLKQVELRNISDFNSRKRDIDIESALKIKIPEKMHYLVCVIDELADLMMVSENNIEAPIARIAQMARAVGIHMILATQRPSREIITGIIKANFPVRIAFKVASRINSQIILDSTGAETLLGNGDMLLLPAGSSHLTRAQGAFVRDKDIKNVISFVCNQASTDYLIKSFEKTTYGDTTGKTTSESFGGDELYQQAFETVVKTGNASTTFLQRKLKVGYARAASLMDQLEEAGVVSSPDGSRARKVLAANTSENE